jgi:hypothetical protein
LRQRGKRGRKTGRAIDENGPARTLDTGLAVRPRRLRPFVRLINSAGFAAVTV